VSSLAWAWVTKAEISAVQNPLSLTIIEFCKKMLFFKIIVDFFEMCINKGRSLSGYPISKGFQQVPNRKFLAKGKGATV
jgi:hypothetical protein